MQKVRRFKKALPMMRFLKQKFSFGLFFSLFFTALFLVCGLRAPLDAATSDWAQGKTKASKVRLLSSLDSISPTTEEFLLGIEFQLEPGWHVYWKNAGDVGYAPKAKWTLPNFWKASDLLYPSPKEFLGSEKLKLVSWGYENAVTYLSFLTRASTDESPQKDLNIALKLDYLVCAEQCIPETASLNISLPVTEEKKSKAYSFLMNVLQSLPPQKDQVGVEWLSPTKLKLSFVEFSPHLISFYSPEHSGKFWSETKINENEFEFEFKKEIKKPMELLAGQKIPGEKRDFFTTEIEAPKNDSPLLSILSILLIAFIGGLLLNLMPCILPVVLMKTHFMFRAKEEGRSFRPSLFFSILGIVSSFIAIGAFTAFLRMSGEQIGWGFQFQSPGFLLFLIILLFLFALNLLGVFEIRLPARWSTKLAAPSGAFLEGVFSTLLATPCSAPFLGTALSFALTQNISMSLFIFFVLGVGLAFPYIIFLASPGVLRFLPRPGNWMLTLKRFLAASIFVVIAWLGYLFLQQIHVLEIKNEDSSFITEVEKEISASKDASKDNEIFFIYITADWCFTCKFNEISLIRTESFEKFLEDQKIQVRRIDWTKREPEVARFLDGYGRVGIPFAMLIQGDRYILFPELMTKEATEKEILEFLKAQR